MSVKFKINKLGPITNSEFEFKPFMIFSGDSSMGKSYCAFLAYYLINLLTDRTNNILKNFIKKEFDIDEVFHSTKEDENKSFLISSENLCKEINFRAKHFLGYLIGDENFDADIEIILPINDFEIKFSKEKGAPENINDFLLEHDFIKISIGEEISVVKKSSAKDINELFVISLLQKHLIKTILKCSSMLRSIFLPPSKAALIGANNSTLNEISKSTGMYSEFIKDMEFILEAKQDLFSPDETIIKIIEDILNGTIVNKKGSLYYKFNGDEIPITAAAASIKELAPLFLLLNKTKPSEFSVLFEEPEAHIHPTLQIKVADMLCKLVNDGAYFQVTTHSDYFLNQINNSINLFNLKEKLKGGFKEFCKENNLDENKILDPKKLGAYYFQRREDGSVEIKTQNVEEGVPFDTFEKSIDTIMRDSAIIENQLEELLD